MRRLVAGSPTTATVGAEDRYGERDRAARELDTLGGRTDGICIHAEIVHPKTKKVQKILVNHTQTVVLLSA